MSFCCEASARRCWMFFPMCGFINGTRKSCFSWALTPLWMLNRSMARTGRPINDAVLSYLEKGVGSVEDVVAALAMDQENIEAFARGGQLITDNDNYLATGSARAMDQGVILRRDRLYETLKPYDPSDSTGQSQLRSVMGERTEFPVYLQAYGGFAGMIQRAIDLAEQSDRRRRNTQSSGHDRARPGTAGESSRVAAESGSWLWRRIRRISRRDMRYCSLGCVAFQRVARRPTTSKKS